MATKIFKYFSQMFGNYLSLSLMYQYLLFIYLVYQINMDFDDLMAKLENGFFLLLLQL